METIANKSKQERDICCTVQYSTVQYSTAQYSIIHCSKIILFIRYNQKRMSSVFCTTEEARFCLGILMEPASTQV